MFFSNPVIMSKLLLCYCIVPIVIKERQRRRTSSRRANAWCVGHFVETRRRGGHGRDAGESRLYIIVRPQCCLDINVRPQCCLDIIVRPQWSLDISGRLQHANIKRPICWQAGVFSGQHIPPKTQEAKSQRGPRQDGCGRGWKNCTIREAGINCIIILKCVWNVHQT